MKPARPSSRVKKPVRVPIPASYCHDGPTSIMKHDKNPRRKPSQASIAQTRQIVASFYRTARRDYLKAGCPFGKTDDAMLIWFEYAQETTVN